MIFTYVDEKRRRRLTLDLYRPAEPDGPLPSPRLDGAGNAALMAAVPVCLPDGGVL